jgi:hypothetical protein
VREYLTQPGLAPSSVTAKGFGKTQPIASNDTAIGRQQNRMGGNSDLRQGDWHRQGITPVAAR